MIEQLANVPAVSFIDNLTLEDVQAALVDAYQTKYQELTGRPIRLGRADAETLKMYAASVVIYQALLYVQCAGEQNLLPTSYGAALDNLAALKGVARLPAQPAETIVRFTLSAPLASAATIPAGTKVTAGNGIFFATAEQTEIPPGELTADVRCICDHAGAAGSGIAPGLINTLVDLLPYVTSVTNITASQGGADIEDDESLAERVYLAPSAYSTAGPRDAYKYHARSYSPLIGSVCVTSPLPREVEVRVLLRDGTLPGESILEGVAERLNDDTVRPLTDLVRVLAPEVVQYDIEVEYWIGRVNAAQAVTIQQRVGAAVEDYKLWQCSEIGRDLNPAQLLARIIAAGAKRANVAEPTFQILPGTSVAQLNNCTVTYRGIEDD